MRSTPTTLAALPVPIGDRISAFEPRAGCTSMPLYERRGEDRFDEAVAMFRARTPAPASSRDPAASPTASRRSRPSSTAVPGLRLTVDTGHVATWGEDPVRLLRHADHVQLRQAAPGSRSCHPDDPDGVVDFAAVLAELDRLDYPGLMSVEYFDLPDMRMPLDDPVGHAVALAAHVRALCPPDSTARSVAAVARAAVEAPSRSPCPTILSMLMKTPMTRVMNVFGPTMRQVTWVAPSRSSSTNVVVLLDLNGLRNCKRDLRPSTARPPSVISMRPGAGLAVARPTRTPRRRPASAPGVACRCRFGSRSSHGDHSRPPVEVDQQRVHRGPGRGDRRVARRPRTRSRLQPSALSFGRSAAVGEERVLGAGLGDVGGGRRRRTGSSRPRASAAASVLAERHRSTALSPA